MLSVLAWAKPDFKTHHFTFVKQPKKAIDDGKYFAYPPVAGYQDLPRSHCSKNIRKKNGVPYKAENIVVSNGAKQSIANVMLAILNPGDEVIILSLHIG